MAKKIYSVCMAFAMMTVLSFVTSCAKEEIEVSVGMQAYNLDYETIEQTTVGLLNNAFQNAVKSAEGSEPSDMANNVKSKFKANIQAAVPSSEIENLKSNEGLYFDIKVFDRATQSIIYSEAKLFGTEL